MSKIESDSIINSHSRSHGGGGYKELEAEIMDRRATQIKSDRRMEEAGFDPRVVASIAEAEAAGFDMQMASDYDLNK